MSDLHVEAFFSDEAPASADGDLIWKEALIEGEFTHPQDRKRKFTVVRDGRSDPSAGIISMSDLVEAHDGGAYDQVQVPLADKPKMDHADYARVNTGFVKKLRIREREDGKAVLDTGVLFTEPDVKGKVERGTVNNCSSGIYFNVEKADGRVFPAAMRHLALTNTNWIPGLKPFVALSEADEDADESVAVELADKGETVWNPKDSLDWLRDKVSSALEVISLAQNPHGIEQPGQQFFFLRDLSPKKALVQQEPESKTFVVPFKKKKDDVELAPQDEWDVAEQEWVAASEDSIFVRSQKIEATDEEQQEEGETETKVETSETDVEDEQQEPANQPTPSPAVFSRERYDSAPDTPEARLRAAQEERQSLLASNDSYRGGNEMAPPTRKGLEALDLDSLNLSDDARSALQAAQDAEREERQTLLSENEQLKKDRRKNEVEEKVTWLKDKLGLSDPGFLKTYRRLRLADDGEPAAVLLSDEEGSDKRVSITLSEGIDMLINALPREDEGEKVALSSQATQLEQGDKPKNTAEDEAPDLDAEVADLRSVLRLPTPAARQEVTA